MKKERDSIVPTNEEYVVYEKISNRRNR